MPFRFQRLGIPGLVLVEPRVFDDNRGFLMESYRKSDFEANGISAEFVQDIHSHSVRGVLRGLHYQMHPAAQAKLVRVVKGEVFDVAVDIRRNAPTFGQWEGVVLSGGNYRMFYVPEGFAHGFCVLSNEAEFIYKVTAEFAPDLDRGILWNDPDIGIDWPVSSPVLSRKDLELPLLAAAENNFVYDPVAGV